MRLWSLIVAHARGGFATVEHVAAAAIEASGADSAPPRIIGGEVLMDLTATTQRRWRPHGRSVGPHREGPKRVRHDHAAPAVARWRRDCWQAYRDGADVALDSGGPRAE